VLLYNSRLKGLQANQFYKVTPSNLSVIAGQGFQLAMWEMWQ
jgi:hypothetical protein